MTLKAAVTYPGIPGARVFANTQAESSPLVINTLADTLYYWHPTLGARQVTAAGGGASRLGFIYSKDFMTAAQIADVESGAMTLDVTAALQAFINACEYRHGIFEWGRHRISASLVFDYTKSYWISGDGFDINTNLGSVIYNFADAPALLFNNTAAANYNPDVHLEHFCITGNQTGLGQKGIYALRTPIFCENIYVVNQRSHGIHVEQGFTCTFKNVILANNYQHGIFLDKEANQIVLDHVIANANSRQAGYAGIAIQGVLNRENLGVKLVGCDTTSNGIASGNGFGIVIQHSRGVSIDTHYTEGNLTRGIFADSTAKNVSVTTSYLQDETEEFASVDGLIVENNNFRVNGAPTTFIVTQGAGLPTRIANNSYVGGVTKTFLGGAYERTDTRQSAAPTTGTWTIGDICWNSAPTASNNLGWVCVTAGTPGTWTPFGAPFTTSALSNITTNMGTLTSGSINTSGGITAAALVSTGGATITSTLTGNAGANFTGNVGAANFVTAGAANSGSITTNFMNYNVASSSGGGTASTAFLATKPGGSTSGEWLPFQKAGVNGYIPWWPA